MPSNTTNFIFNEEDISLAILSSDDSSIQEDTESSVFVSDDDTLFVSREDLDLFVWYFETFEYDGDDDAFVFNEQGRLILSQPFTSEGNILFSGRSVSIRRKEYITPYNNVYAYTSFGNIPLV